MNNSTVQVGICHRLEIILEAKGISKAEMARRSNLPSRTVENYFKGHTPSVDALLSLSSGLSVPIDWLLGDVNYPGTEINTRVFRSAEDAAREYLQTMVEVESTGNKVIQGVKILGQDVDELAAKIGNNAHQKFKKLSLFSRDEIPIIAPETE